MKIAIASLKDDVNSEVSPQAGRAPYYLIFDNKELIEAWKNPFTIGGGGAGPAVARYMSEKGVEKIVAGNLGGNMESALTSHGIEFIKKNDVLIQDVLSELI